MRISIVIVLLILVNNSYSQSEVDYYDLADIVGIWELNYAKKVNFDCDTIDYLISRNKYGRTFFEFGQDSICNYTLWGSKVDDRYYQLENDTIKIFENNPEVCNYCAWILIIEEINKDTLSIYQFECDNRVEWDLIRLE